MSSPTSTPGVAGRRRRAIDEAEAQLEESVEQLWLAGVEADELVARVRAIVAEYAASTERYDSPAR